MNRQYLGEKRTGIIFAADLPTTEDNRRVLKLISRSIDVIKVCSPLIYTEGMRAIRELADEFKLPLFADLKVADVPHTDAAIVRLARANGAAAVMVHGFVGPDAIADCIEAGGDETAIIAQLELTHPGGAIFNQPIADDMARAAMQCGVYGVQAPGNRPARIQRIRDIVGPEPAIVCCGVGRQGGTYQEVMANGGDYAIIGRAIYQAVDPIVAIEEILHGTPA